MASGTGAVSSHINTLGITISLATARGGVIERERCAGRMFFEVTERSALKAIERCLVGRQREEPRRLVLFFCISGRRGGWGLNCVNGKIRNACQLVSLMFGDRVVGQRARGASVQFLGQLLHAMPWNRQGCGNDQDNGSAEKNLALCGQRDPELSKSFEHHAEAVC